MVKTEEIVEAVKSVLPKRRPIEHHEPFVNKQRAKAILNKCIDLNPTSKRYVEEFEEWLADLYQVEHAIATCSGTAALHIAIAASCDIRHYQRLGGCLVPSATFVATANAVVHAGAIPYFIDGSPTLDPHYLREWINTHTKPPIGKLNYTGSSDRGRDLGHGGGDHLIAVIPVHLFGHAADVAGINKVAKEHKLVVIEDAAQAMGTTINGKMVGTNGWAGILSFNNNKILTTNGGGAILTNSPGIAYDARQLINTARTDHPWLVEHTSMAWNYRMGNINAALGVSQIPDFKKTLAAKRDLAVRYRKALSHLVKFVEPTTQCEPNYWLNVILVENRDEVLNALHKEGIKARAMFTPLHSLPFYQFAQADYAYQYNLCKGGMSKVTTLFNKAVCLPSGVNL
jgi:perosamine synthetase